MNIIETGFAGVFIIEPQTFADERGSFSALWSTDELNARGMTTEFVQANLSHNKLKGTLRGLHFQEAPNAQAKFLMCVRGSIFDVGVDLRPESETFKQWIGCELSAANGRMLYLPEDFAHGYLTLEDDSSLFYQVSAPYSPGSSRGFRWNDPAFGIQWPDSETLIINERDRTYPDFDLIAQNVS